MGAWTPRRSWGNLQNDLAEVLVGLDDPVRFRRLGERKDAVDGRTKPARGEQRQPALAETAGDLDLLLERAVSQHRSEDLQPPAQENTEIDLDLRAAEQSDQQEAACLPEGTEVPLPVLRPDEIEDEIDPLPTGLLAHPAGEIPLLVAAPGFGTQLQGLPDLPGRAGGHQDARPGGAGHLHGGRSDAAAGGMDEDRLAPSQIAKREEGLLGGAEGFWDGGGLRECPSLRDPHPHPMIDDRPFHVGSSANEGEDPVPRGETLGRG